MTNPMFNSDQNAYMEELGRIGPSGLCWCGWYQKGECVNGCDPALSAADKLAAACPECGNYPQRPGHAIAHRKACASGRAPNTTNEPPHAAPTMMEPR